MVLGLGVAVVFNRDFRGKAFVRTITLLPMVATPVAIALIWALMFNPSLGVLNYLLESLGLPRSLWVPRLLSSPSPRSRSSTSGSGRRWWR